MNNSAQQAKESEAGYYWLLDGTYDSKLKALNLGLVDFREQARPLARLKMLVGDRQCKGILIRYLKLRRPLFAVFYYWLVVIFTKIKKKQVVFFLHNFYEHTSSNILVNDHVRNLIAGRASKIFVFDEAMKEFVRRENWFKLEVLGFGPILESLVVKNDIISRKTHLDFFSWLDSGDVDVISVTTARQTNLQLWIDNIPAHRRVLVVDPNCFYKSNSSNVFVLQSALYNSWSVILPKLSKAVGLLAHNNGSVPTSLRLFAELSLPVIVDSISPIDKIVQREGIGQVCGPKDFEEEYLRIKEDRQWYSLNCERFSEHYTWEKCSEKFREFF